MEGASAACCLARRIRGWLPLGVHRSCAGGDPVVARRGGQRGVERGVVPAVVSIVRRWRRGMGGEGEESHGCCGNSRL